MTTRVGLLVIIGGDDNVWGGRRFRAESSSSKKRLRMAPSLNNRIRWFVSLRPSRLALDIWSLRDTVSRLPGGGGGVKLGGNHGAGWRILRI